ncbi:BSD-like protein [Senna tora]|uniref:BSD-like protein n=1 Tax=Senna tora TaxID=362788 RepID=A0A834W5D2_9FABA|nr:BSD-like protein [Senna tora]
MAVSEVDSAARVCDSTGGGNARRRPFWARGGRCFAGFLDWTFQGKNTPVPPRGSLRGFNTIGRTGVNITIGARIIPHLGIISMPSLPLKVPFGKAYGLAIPGCQRLIAVAMGEVGDWHWLESGLTLKKLMLTLLLGDGHITCLAMSALFPLITIIDLRSMDDFISHNEDKGTTHLLIIENYHHL